MIVDINDIMKQELIKVISYEEVLNHFVSDIILQCVLMF